MEGLGLLSPPPLRHW